MADRYWVGGTASWDGTAGTKWATTSGGTGGAAIPTTADDVFFSNLSTGTVTIATGNTGAKSITCTGFAGTITGTATITIAGSLTLNSTMVYSHTGTTTFTGTGTITSAGKTIGRTAINGTGITVTLGDAFICGVSLDLINGTFNTANFNLAPQSIFVTTGTKTLTLGSSTVTLATTGNTINFADTTNFTFNPGTSTIILSGAFFTTVIATPLTFYNLQLTSTTPAASALTNGVLQASTWNNITVTPATSGVKSIQFAGNVTAASLAVSGPTYANRVMFWSSVPGTARTLTLGTLSADHCDFAEITLAGAAAPASPTGAGDLGGNTSITFPAAKSVYRVGTGTTWADATGWAASSGGASSSANFPLAQDTAYVENVSTAVTLTTATYNRGTLDFSNRTNALSLSFGAVANFFGSLTLGSGVTPAGTSIQYYRGRGISTLSLAGKTLLIGLAVVTPVGTLQLGSAFTSTANVSVSQGTFNANNYNVTCLSFSSTGALVRTVTMGSGLWTLSGTASMWDTGTVTNLTFNKDTANILLSNTTTTARTFSGATLSFNKLTIGGDTGISTLTIGGNTFTELASIKTVAHTIRLSTSTTVIGVWSVRGTLGNVVTLNSSTTGTRRTFSLANATSGIDYLSVQDIGVTPADRFYVGANSTNLGNNLNVIFTDAPGGVSYSPRLLFRMRRLQPWKRRYKV